MTEDESFHADEITWQLSQLVREEIGARGMTQGQLARKAGLSDKSVVRAVSAGGTTLPTYARLLAALDLPVDIVRRER